MTLIDTYTHFEVHVDLPVECLDDLCPKIFPVVRKAIFKGLSKATLNLGYYNSSPSPALLCPCGVGEAHVATANPEIGYWTCTLNKRKCGKLTPRQLLWVDNTPTVTADSDHKHLTESDLPGLLSKLDGHAHRWRAVSYTHLTLPTNREV